MNNIQYKIHLLLNSKHKFLINILIYIFIIYIYNIYFNDITIIECMRRNTIDPTSPESTESEYVNYLEESAWKMDKRIAELENELKIYKYKDQVVDRVTQIEKDIEQIKTSVNALNDRIDNVENNEPRLPFNLPFCNIL